jgi:BASS family bile acid:Na+ symporter
VAASPSRLASAAADRIPGSGIAATVRLFARSAMAAAHVIPLVAAVSLWLTVFGLGLAATADDVTSLFRRPRLLLRSVLVMNVVMPGLALAVVLLELLPPTVGIALMALMISPVEPALPRRAMRAAVRTSYAVGLLVSIWVLAIPIVPLSVMAIAAIFQRQADLDVWVIGRTLLLTVFVPLVSGMVGRRLWPRMAERSSRPIILSASVLLVLCALALLPAAWPGVRALIGDGAVAILAAIVAVGMLCGHAFGGPDPQERVVLALSTVARHPALALAAATAGARQATEETAAILLYLITAALVSLPYIVWSHLRRRA